MPDRARPGAAGQLLGAAYKVHGLQRAASRAATLLGDRRFRSNRWVRGAAERVEKVAVAVEEGAADAGGAGAGEGEEVSGGFRCYFA